METEKPWTAFYDSKARHEIVNPAHRTLGDLVRSVAETYQKAPAFTACMPNGMNGTLSFRDVDAMSDDFAVYLREVAGLVEWPVTLMGEIGEAFLGLPPEVLQTSMKEHQKFFSVRNPKTGRI